jgi:hypothetical protein
MRLFIPPCLITCLTFIEKNICSTGSIRERPPVNFVLFSDPHILVV